MGATTTQSRRIPNPLVGVTVHGDGTVFKGPWSLYGPTGDGVQTTTSYRSGRRVAGGIDQETEDDTAILSAKNYSERFKALKTSSRRESSTPSTDTGHEFDSKKQWVDCTTINTTALVGSRESYTGPAWPDLATLAVPASRYIEMAPPDLGWYGPRAISRTTPTNPAADLAMTLAELKREGLPRVPGNQLMNRTDRARRLGGESQRFGAKTGSEYLNIEFGWKPLVRDMQQIAHAVRNANKILDQHAKNSGKNIRRKFSFPEERQSITLPTVTGLLHNISDSTGWRDAYESSSPTCRIQETTEFVRTVWFSGAYTYLVPTEMNNFRGQLGEIEQKANLLLGTRLSPDVLWNLAPWSWLSDWNANIGDNIANASALAADGLVLRYGYLMVQTVSIHSHTAINPRLSHGRGVTPATIAFNTVRKQRFRASPFGFGSNPSSYTARQWSILGALGMTKGDKSLRLND